MSDDYYDRKRKKHKKHKHKKSKKRERKHHSKKDKYKDKHRKKRKHSNEEDIRHHRKKRKINDNNDDNIDYMDSAKQMIKIYFENESETREDKMELIDIIKKLDNGEEISLDKKGYNTEFRQFLHMMLTFLKINTQDNIHFSKDNNSIGNISNALKDDLKYTDKPTIIGPQLPSINANNTVIIGPTMPGSNIDNNNNNSDSDDDDLIGPSMISNNMSKNDQERIKQMEASKIVADMNKEINDNIIKNDDIKDTKRESWMTEIPTALGMNNAFKMGTTNRGFNKNDTNNTNNSNSINEWTQTPQDIEIKKHNDKIRIIAKQKADKKLKEMGLPSIYEMELKKKNQQNIQRNIEENKFIQNRGKSLYELHNNKMMKEYQEELLKWKKDKKNGKKVGKKPVFNGNTMNNNIDDRYTHNFVDNKHLINNFKYAGVTEDY